ncbi:MAG: YifB family Mg chelatase-like AAA ATPase [Armatimonadetes bacterium]|nr:YifB family Mg chelatase-like AAA ATPase [Armatimonadota bacterium]
MLARVPSATVVGLDGHMVTVEVDVSGESPAFNIVGLPDPAVRESKDRVQSAIRNSGFYFPEARITVNLAPADLRKQGPLFDLPIAIGLLLATGQCASDVVSDVAIVGELGLDGLVRPVHGVLPMAIGAARAGVPRIIVPTANAKEAAVVQEIEVYTVETLYDTVRLLETEFMAEPVKVNPEDLSPDRPCYDVDFGDVRGQELAKRALEVAVAGGHHLLMIGPPGVGKTMLAQRVPTIMPPMSLQEALEVTQIYSVAGLLPSDTAIVRERPFRNPHHSISVAGLIGGGSIPQPGEVSLAHNGVLFLDELPEFPRQAIEGMREPLESGEVVIARAQLTVRFPARFQLIADMNPCPCGHYGDPARPCHCAPGDIARYRRKISGPVLDRIDIHMEVPRLKAEELMAPGAGEPSEKIRSRVMAARERQQRRYAGTPFFKNADLTARAVREFCRLKPEAEALLRAAMDQFALSARAHDKVLKVARTIADLEGSDDISTPHVAEAIQYRITDRRLWLELA